MRVYPLHNPFLALRSFERADAARLFGRDGDLVLVHGRLSSAGTTLLFAASGVGKTSFLNARLRPSLEGTTFVVTHRAWATDAPLDALRQSVAAEAPHLGIGALPLASQLKAVLAARPADAGRPGRAGALLILDQFEEVFQRWRETRALDDFARDIAELVHAPEAHVRVLISMREEFLGELSLFDNLIPDLFNNCYRLKNPTRAEAEEIITRTAYSQNRVECGPALDALLEDLLATRRDEHPERAAEPSAQSRIPMPFLQIVCHRLWHRELGDGHNRAHPFAERFLDTYEKGDAARELDRYCRDKIETLDLEQRDIAAAAFGFLMTPGGAKMAYPVDVLARQAHLSEPRLEGVLRALSAPDVRILRGIPVSSGARPWFELYHNLYARFLSTWKREHDQRREAAREEERAAEAEARRAQAVREAVAHSERRLALYRRVAYYSPILFVLVGWLLSSTNDYFNYYRPLVRFLRTGTNQPTADDYLAARTATQKVQSSYLFADRARAEWAAYWRSRAQRELIGGQYERAILSQLRSLQEQPDEVSQRQLTSWMERTSEWRRVLRAPDTLGTFGYFADGARIYAVLPKCRLLLWTRATGEAMPIWSPPERLKDCQSLTEISPDGEYVLAIVADGNALALLHRPSSTELWRRSLVDTQGRRLIVAASFGPDSRTLAAQVGEVVVTVTLAPSPSQIRTREFTVRPTSPRAVILPLPDGVYGGRWVRTDPAKALIEIRDSDGRTTTTLSAADSPLATSFGIGNTFTLLSLANGRYAAAGDGKVYFLDEAKPPDLRYSGPLGAIDAIASGSDVLVRNGDYQTIRRITPQGPTATYVLPPPYFQSFFAAAADGTVLLAGGDGRSVYEVELREASALPTVSFETDSTIALSPDGRWLLVHTQQGASSLKDLTPAGASDRPLDTATYTFSPSGHLMLEVQVSGPVRTIDPATLAAVTLPVTSESGPTWASDRHLTFRDPERRLALLELPTNRREVLDPDADNRSPYRFDNPGCPTSPFGSQIVVDPEGRYALASPYVFGRPGSLVLYRHSASGWARSAVENSGASSTFQFSSDARRFLAVFGADVGLWSLPDARQMATFTDNRLALCTATFGPNGSIVAVTTDPVLTPSDLNLLVWDPSTPQEPPSRQLVPTANYLTFGSHMMSRLFASDSATALVQGQAIVWVVPSATGSPTLRVRPVHAYLGAAASPIQPLPEVAMAHDGAVRLVVPVDNTRLLNALFPMDFSDVAPFSPGDRPWSAVLEDWSRRLDLRVNPGTGQYEEMTMPAATPALSPPAKTAQPR